MVSSHLLSIDEQSVHEAVAPTFVLARFLPPMRTVRKTGDSFGTTGGLSTEKGDASFLSPLGRQREQGGVHRVGSALSARQRWQKCSCPHARLPSTTTTMYL